MAKKRRVKKPPREPTRRQLAKWQQQKRRQRITLITGVTIIAAVIILLGVGWYLSQYLPLHDTAIIVNDTEFNMKYYIDALKFQGRNQSAEYIGQIADSVIDDIEQNELIRQAAGKLGISVSDDEVRERLKSAGFPNDAVHRDIVRTGLLISKLRDEYFDKQVPVTAEQVHIMAMLLESERQAREVRNRLDHGESFADLARELSVNSLTRVNDGDLGWHPKSILSELLYTSVPAEYAFTAEVGSLSQPLRDEEVIKQVGYWLIKVTERDEAAETAHVHAILLGSKEEAEAVRARLEAGEEFATVAKETSQLPSAQTNEGDLGQMSKGATTPVLDEYIFNNGIELNTLSEPIRDETMTTTGGYWLIKVIDRGERQIEEGDRDMLKMRALQEWIDSLWDDPDNLVDDTFLDAEKIAWAVEQAVQGMK